MIDYLGGDSSYYNENKFFCENVELKLRSYNPKLRGYCGSSGFKIYCNFNVNTDVFDIKYEKYYHTQGGRIFIYAYSNYILETTFKRRTYNYNEFLIIQKSYFKRLFMNQRLKSIVPKGYYLRTNININKLNLTKLFREIYENKIRTLRIKNSNLYFKIYDKEFLPDVLISKSDYLLQLCRVTDNPESVKP